MQLIKRYALPLALALIGFLLGMFWGNLSPLIKPFFSDISSRSLQLESYVQTHPLESGLTFAVLGAFISPVAKLLRSIASYLTRRPTMIDLMFREEDSVHIVTSHMRQTSFRQLGTNKDIVLPENALFMAASVALGTQYLSSYCQKRYGDRKSANFHYHDDWGLRDHTFICLGGPFVNKIVKSILDQNTIPDFTIDDIPTVIDQGDRYEAQREHASTAKDAPLVKDYGVIIFMQSPWNPAKKVCVLFGLWPQGTLAAIDAMLEHGNRSPLSEQYYRALKNGRNVLGIIEVTVTGRVQGIGKFVKVRPF